jgi:ribosomal protein L14E/L6E/L27E
MALVGQGINARPYLKITKAKRTSGVAQVIEHMATQYKTLSSIPSTATKKKERKVLCKVENKKTKKKKQKATLQFSLLI